MSEDKLLTVSSLMFGYCGRNGRLAAFDARGGARYRLGPRVATVISAFLDPRSIDSAVADGFTAEELDEAERAGILVPAAETEQLGLWERNGWSRAAYLLFSQMDIPYLESESPVGADDRAGLMAVRRSVIEDYQGKEDYPLPLPLASGDAIALPEASEHTTSLSTFRSRRSARAFAKDAPSAEQLAYVLHRATHGFRTVARDRAAGDPFRLLNSFYSWAHLFVVVQHVERIPRGIFEYDWREHQLLGVASAPSNEALLECVQGQGGILGTGFVVFVVGDMRSYAWLYRHSRAYVHLLIQLGELGQELLTAAGDVGLSGWTTPALHESKTARLLHLPEEDALDALSMVKLGLRR